MHRLPSFKIHAACGTCGILERGGKRFNGEDVMRGMANMHERGNGLAEGIGQDAGDSGQIEEYLSVYRGEGIQHIAVGTNEEAVRLCDLALALGLGAPYERRKASLLRMF